MYLCTRCSNAAKYCGSECDVMTLIDRDQHGQDLASLNYKKIAKFEEELYRVLCSDFFLRCTLQMHVSDVHIDRLQLHNAHRHDQMQLQSNSQISSYQVSLSLTDSGRRAWLRYEKPLSTLLLSGFPACRATPAGCLPLLRGERTQTEAALVGCQLSCTPPARATTTSWRCSSDCPPFPSHQS